MTVHLCLTIKVLKADEFQQRHQIPDEFQGNMQHLLKKLHYVKIHEQITLIGSYEDKGFFLFVVSIMVSNSWSMLIRC